MPVVIKYTAIGNATVNVMLRGPLVEMIIRGRIATNNAVIMAAMFNEAVDAILLVIFKKTTENNTRWQSYLKI